MASLNSVAAEIDTESVGNVLYICSSCTLINGFVGVLNLYFCNVLLALAQ